MNDLQKDRLLELLADQTIFGLSEEELVELKELKRQFPDWEKELSLELTAAAIGLSDLDVSDELPVNLREKIFANAEEFFGKTEASQEVVNFAPQAAEPINSPATASITNIVETAPERPFWQWLGWAVAAAACVALAINIWSTRSPQPEVAQNSPVAQSPTPQLSAAQERAQLLAAASDKVEIPLANPKNEKEILGEMVWSNKLQKGYVHFSKLPANDVAKETYQLWIVDATRDQKTPVNGGVFDVSATGEVTIPVDPELTIRKPAAIAVTKEKPGGVVVSAQENVVALAKI